VLDLTPLNVVLYALRRLQATNAIVHNTATERHLPYVISWDNTELPVRLTLNTDNRATP